MLVHAEGAHFPRNNILRVIVRGARGCRDPASATDNLAAFINSMGHTEVLQRESEASLARMVQRGAVAEQRMAAQQERLGQPPSLEEAAAEQARRSHKRLALHSSPADGPG